MFKFLIAGWLCLAPLAASAGDGGYTILACLSGSGRTQLNVFQDNYSGSAHPFTIRLIVDGQQAEYISADNESANIRFDWDNGIYSVVENGAEVLNLTDTGRAITIKRGFQDPRVGTDFERYGNNQRDIVVNCKRYDQGP